MLINSLVGYGFGSKLSKQQVHKSQSVSISVPNFKPTKIGYYPHPSIAFKSSHIPGLPASLRDLPCPSCGILMVTYEDFARALKPENLRGSSKTAIEFLQPFEDSMHNVERLCFEKVKQFSKHRPEASLQEILINFRLASLEQLKANQLEVLNRIGDSSARLPRKLAMELRRLLYKARGSVLEDNGGNPFRRKGMIDNITALVSEIPQKRRKFVIVGDEILNLASSLPNSTNNPHAFIVNYSQHSSSEIGQRLVSPSIISEDHIIPRSPKDTKRPKGETNAENLIYECRGCNSGKSNSSEVEYVTAHPAMPVNAQRYYDVIIGKMNSGEISFSRRDLFAQIKRLEEESKGLIQIDTSKLIDIDVRFDRYRQFILTRRLSPSVA